MFVCMSLSVCLSVCTSPAIPQKLLVIIIILGTMIASVIRMHHVSILVILTFIQGHTYLNHENNKCSIVSETVQAMPITFAVKIVRLKPKIYMIFASPMTFTFIQSHNYVSNVTNV